MPRINLLPWRETLKKEREIRFGIITGVSLVLTGLVVLGVHIYFESEIGYQQKRNKYLQREIKKAEDQIKEIEQLDEKKQHLIERRNAIQKLEESRPQVVHLFDEFVRRVPNGVYFTTMAQKNNQITLEGVAQSEGRISSLMKNFETSQWVSHPKIIVIKRNKKGVKQTNKKSNSVFLFKLEMTQNALQLQ
ncbi:PilN domain-containing protein [Candidatus Parabeggiatoa sp. HSG14]|uniref:PilN domain-containing protein n=1 Tax=Candidatus Parabeggiatoa sp. HSG14 TaxID=3055593 RepID=UPI0025A80E3F|nr:PilN domain-containing protein [Thiotrichales bacterium HSG14]